ncbi:MFS transporter [Pseudonocardia yunnanensis]
MPSVNLVISASENPITRELVAADEVGHRRGTREFRRVNLALVAGACATFAVLYSMQALFPAVGRQFGVSPAIASLTLSVPTAVLALSTIPLAAVSKTHGRTKVMSISIVATAVIGLAVPFAPSFAVLLVLRGLEGCALAGLQATAMSYLSEELHHSSLGSGMGLYVAGTAFGGMLGRTLAGAVVDFASWRVALATVSVLSVFAAVVFIPTILPSRNFRPVPLRFAAAPGSGSRTFSDRGLTALYVIGFLDMAGFVTVYNYLGYRLLSPEFGLSQALVGALFVIYVTGAGASTVAGRLVGVFSYRAVLWPSALVALAGVVLMLSSHVAVIVIGLVLVTIGFFATHSVASGWVGARSGQLRGSGPAAYLFCYYLGSSIGGTVGGVWYGRSGWNGLSIYLAVIFAAIIAVGVSLRHLRPIASSPVADR